ncbi:hypothetical protein [Mucilaginibacter flavidus]|uniref:hypothetical protein n=1 Tax=Mucilaginibacter flavidus TaxID=2949309 RepID=UPI002091EA20|nr:hypothetical protein [Mucilaginibacter flavidus]MCO5945641.1 hypothetical protein [Mucilaginibacter flavidus]
MSRIQVFFLKYMHPNTDIRTAAFLLYALLILMFHVPYFGLWHQMKIERVNQ